MSNSKIKSSSRRSPSCVDRRNAGPRLQSADGSRWAIPGNYKLPLPDRQWSVVVAYAVWERGSDGKARRIDTRRSESSARHLLGLL